MATVEATRTAKTGTGDRVAAPARAANSMRITTVLEEVAVTALDAARGCLRRPVRPAPVNPPPLAFGG